MFNLSLFNQAPCPFPLQLVLVSAGLGVSALRNLGSHALHMLTFLSAGSRN